jgi:outer membrane protein assembly factor BamA
MDTASRKQVAILAALGLSCAVFSAPAATQVLPRIDSRAPKVSLDRPADVPSDAELEAAGARIGAIRIVRRPIFDLSNPEENTAIPRLANRLHITTRESTIRDQLLFATGEPYRGRLLEESARILRSTRYLRDAVVRPVAYRDGVVDVEVAAQDVWTLNPGLSFGRKGGKSTTGVELEEFNLLGTGARLSLDFLSGVERDSTTLFYSDAQLGSSWWGLSATYSDNSDGERVALDVTRPFYALDTRWAAGVGFSDDERIDSRYDRGEVIDQYAARQRGAGVFWGRSSGLRGDWVRRYTVGWTHDEREYATLVDAAGAPRTRLRPEDRRLSYPWVGVEWQQSDFRIERNRDQIEKIEDFALGWRVNVSLGLATKSLGSDRDALPFRAGLSKGLRPSNAQTWLFDTYAFGRIESGDVESGVAGGSMRYFFKQSLRRTLYLSLSGDIGERLDAAQQISLGGDSGLRGYPLRYESGTSRWLFTAEQRFYTSWYPFRLFHVGGAVFYDMGRTHGRDALAAPSLGLLRDVGFGLRFGNSRSGLGSVLHVDFAFPLDGDDSIDSAQVLVETKRSF